MISIQIQISNAWEVIARFNANSRPSSKLRFPYGSLFMKLILMFALSVELGSNDNEAVTPHIDIKDYLLAFGALTNISFVTYLRVFVENDSRCRYRNV